MSVSSDSSRLGSAKEAVFVGPQIREIVTDSAYHETFNEAEGAASRTLKQ
jgi:hypothetical protein